MSLLEVQHPGVYDLVDGNATITRVAGGLGFTEGPVWRGSELLFSDIPNRRIVRWRQLREGPELTTYKTGFCNGITLDEQGRILVAEHDGRCVSRVAADGQRTVLAANFEGQRLNSPNDIVVKSDGSIYFTDPPYGLTAGMPELRRRENWWLEPIPGKELRVNGVYLLKPGGAMQLVADDAVLPNGLAFSPDETLLYVDDSALKHIRVFDVNPDGTLTNDRLFLDMSAAASGVPDGLKVDLHGNVFCTGPGGIWIARADARLLGRIRIPEQPSNLAWGEDGTVLFITACTSVYRLQTKTRGRLLA